MAYIVVEGQGTKFASLVNEHLRNGWKCQGGVSMAAEIVLGAQLHRPVYKISFAQAMIKEE